MKLKVTCPCCGHQFEGEVLKSIQGENFIVCKHEVNSIRLEKIVIKYFCNTYIPISAEIIHATADAKI